jgi:hypothetical protein
MFFGFIMLKLGFVIEHKMPRETLEDKLLIVLAFIGGFIVLYFITNIIYNKYITNGHYTHPHRTACLFIWVVGSAISLFRIFIR